MGWFMNVLKSLSDAGGEITQSEATEVEVKEFLNSMGEGTNSDLIKDLENGLELESRKSLVKRLNTKNLENKTRAQKTIGKQMQQKEQEGRE